MISINKGRQGEALLLRTDISLGDIEPAPMDPRGVVISEGSTSAHYHVAQGPNVRLMRRKASPQELVVVAGEGTVVRAIGAGSGEDRPRHEPIPLSAGLYELRVQRTWTSANASARVED